MRGGNVQLGDGRSQRFDLHGVRTGDVQHHGGGLQRQQLRGMYRGKLLPERIGRDHDLPGRLLLPGELFRADGMRSGNV